MSTCPRCKGFLDDAHVCPRSPARRAAEIAAFGLAGGLVALLIVVLLNPAGAPANISAAALIAGAAIAMVIRRRLSH